MKKQLTQKQEDLLNYCKDTLHRSARFPTYAQIMEWFSFASGNSVTQYLFALERKGYIRKGADGWELVPDHYCPACGSAVDEEIKMRLVA